MFIFLLLSYDTRNKGLFGGAWKFKEEKKAEWRWNFRNLGAYWILSAREAGSSDSDGDDSDFDDNGICSDDGESKRELGSEFSFSFFIDIVSTIYFSLLFPWK